MYSFLSIVSFIGAANASEAVKGTIFKSTPTPADGCRAAILSCQMGIPETNVATFWDILDSFKCQGQAVHGSICEGVQLSQTYVDVVDNMVACAAILPYPAPYDDLSKPAFVNKDGTPNLKPDDKQEIFSLLVYGDVPFETQAYSAMEDIFKIAVTWQMYHLNDPNGNAPKCQEYFGKEGGNHGVPGSSDGVAKTENKQAEDVSRRLLTGENGCKTVTKSITVPLLFSNWDAQKKCPGYCSSQLPGWKFNGQWRQTDYVSSSQCDCTHCVTPAPVAPPTTPPPTAPVASPTPQPTSCETVTKEVPASDWIIVNSQAQSACAGACLAGWTWNGNWQTASSGFKSYCECQRTDCHPATQHA